MVQPPAHLAECLIGAPRASSHDNHIAAWTRQASWVDPALAASLAASPSFSPPSWPADPLLDGLHRWKINAPVSDDLSSVIAVSATNGTISAAAGRRFSTSDGGATWRPL